MALPDTIEARTVRIRNGAATDDDLTWLRATMLSDAEVGRVAAEGRIPRPSVVRLRCDCRCHCHEYGGKAGACSLAIDLDTLDCHRGCRSAHILASECNLDETRAKVAAHV